jgi:phosphoglycolate phosphatase
MQTSDKLHEDININNHTTASIIELARKEKGWTDWIEQGLWDTVKRVEKQGMEGAILEPGVHKMLNELKDSHVLTILTNNAFAAANQALTDHGINEYFELVIGREQMEALKPSSSGVRVILSHFSNVPLEQWLFIGDSWIDAKAAHLANVKFIAYQADVKDMNKHECTPAAYIQSMKELVQYIKDKNVNI